MNLFSPSIWADMGDRFQFTYERNRPEVLAQIAWFQAHQDILYKTLASSAAYISYVYEETKKRNLPAELALLPIIESECNPNARSKKGASGLWQLMPRTATDLGLKRNSVYDGRKDIIASTDAALDYLGGLHQAFSKDWLLAMAAYNHGPGNLQNAIDRQKKWYKSASFWNLHLPNETQKYVPKILALAAVIHHPGRYGIKLPPLSNDPKLASVQARSSTELENIIQASGINIETLRRLNPAYKHLAATAGAPNHFLIPITQKKQVLAFKYPSMTSHAVLKNMIKESTWLMRASI